MSIDLSRKSQKYLIKNKVQNILIDVDFIVESCAEIYDPRILVLKKKDLEKFKDLDNISNGDLTLYISKDFVKVFGKLENYQLDTNGIFRNKLFLSNVDPIIKDTCKTN